MPNNHYLSGYVYHMLPLENFISVLANNALFATSRLNKMGISFQSIANQEVQRLRSRIYVFDTLTQKYCSLHNYVPFYFTTHTPMLYQVMNNGQKEIVIVAVDRSTTFETPGVVFTDGNASMQQLSKYGDEKVAIIPASIQHPISRRRYHPDGPLGQNTSRSDFFRDIELLNRLNWDIINGRSFANPEEKRLKHAEVLVPNNLSLHDICSVSVPNEQMVNKVNAIIDYHQVLNFPRATCAPHMFFYL